MNDKEHEEVDPKEELEDLETSDDESQKIKGGADAPPRDAATGLPTGKRL